MKQGVVLALARLSVAVAGACSDDGPDCDGGECVACVASNPVACTGDTICMDELCVPAFGRSYMFTVTSGTLPSVDNVGASWDESGGLPDPYVELTIRLGAYASLAVDDSLTPTWNFSTPPIDIYADSLMAVLVADYDDPVAQLAWRCPAAPLPVEYLRAGGFDCSGADSLPGARVEVTITPAAAMR